MSERSQYTVKITLIVSASSYTEALGVLEERLSTANGVRFAGPYSDPHTVQIQDMAIDTKKTKKA